MKIREYKSLEALQKEAAKINAELLETNISWSFSIFKNKQRTFLHIYYKTMFGQCKLIM